MGTNHFRSDEAINENIQKINQSASDEHISRLEDIRERRNSSEVKNKLKSLEHAARNGDNVMPKLIDSVKSYATIGEISDTLRKVFGEYS